MAELYDKTSPKSIEEYARQLLGTTLREYTHGEIAQRSHGKGNLGQLLEEDFFHYKVNSRSEPDFAEAGVELKSTPMKTLKSGELVAKERLVLNIINYMEECKQTFRTSSFWHKNRHLLLMFYLWVKGQLGIDCVFKIIRLWQYPATDLKIIKDDWNVIHKKIMQGKADEISEGDTFYLAACPKGASSQSLREQPFSDRKAMQRAYSLKPKYMNSIIRISESGVEPKIDMEEIDWVLDEWEDGMAREPFAEYKRKKAASFEPIVKSVGQYETKSETFSEYVESQFAPYFGMTEEQIACHFGLQPLGQRVKSRYWLLTKAILGIHKDKVEEFEKAGITVKTIRLNKKGRLRESMSFPAIQYGQIVEEQWEDSPFYETLSNKFFFVVYQEQADGQYSLLDAFFWNMPLKDMESVRLVWEDTKRKIQDGDFTHFTKITENPISHVRPHARDSHDLMLAPNHTWQKKYCFWLNRSYVSDIVSSRIAARG